MKSQVWQKPGDYINNWLSALCKLVRLSSATSL